MFMTQAKNPGECAANTAATGGRPSLGAMMIDYY
jgi:hypothetical protein